MGQRYSNKLYKIILLRLKIGIFNAKLVLSSHCGSAEAAFIRPDRGILRIFFRKPPKGDNLFCLIYRLTAVLSELAEAESEGRGHVLEEAVEIH
jgi:hypothetical protein